MAIHRLGTNGEKEWVNLIVVVISNLPGPLVGYPTIPVIAPVVNI